MNLNKVLLVGRATVAPELKTTNSGAPVTSIGLATNRSWTDKAGKKQEEVEFHTVIFWGRQAEVAAQYVVKGAMLLIEGRLKTRAWVDKNSQQRKSTEIICERMQLGPKPAGNATQSTKPAQERPPSLDDEVPVINLEDESEIKAEDIPF